MNLTRASTVFSPDPGRALSFDREGRLRFFYRFDETFKRSLASEVHWRLRKPERQRRRLSGDESLRVFEEVHSIVEKLSATTRGELRRRLQEEVLPWTPQRLAAEAERFARAYKPVSILPPDQYLAVVLQATEGCSWNRCSFCNFYMNRPFHIVTEERFAAHCRAVRALFGRALRLRKGIFLADGNALALSNRRLMPLLDMAQEVFPERTFSGFVDVFSGDRKSVSDWSLLGERGLERVYIGIESGLDELLTLVNKPGTSAEATEFVGLLKGAGLRVGLVVIIGLGGSVFREAHRAATLELLAGLPLGDGDLVYLSPFVEHSRGDSQRPLSGTGSESIPEHEVEEELVMWARRLRRLGLKVSRYDIREFVY